VSTQTVFVTAGATSKTIDVALVQKAAATSPGDPITGLAFNTSSFTAYYRKGATGTATAITLATQTVGGAYSSGGFVEVSSTNAPGLYRFDIPNTVIDTAGFATVTFNGAANQATHTVYIVVTAIDLYDTVRGGMTALPNAAAQAAGGLFTRGTGAGQINQTANGLIDVDAVAISTDTTAANNLEAMFDGNGYAGGTTKLQVDLAQWLGVAPAALVSQRVDTTVGAMQSGVITATATAADCIDASALAPDAVAEIVAGVKAMVIETNGSVTLGQAMSVFLAVLAGVTATGGGVIKDPSGTATRVTATPNGSNERVTMVLNPSA
jgi:hypothetical protein